MCYMLNCNKKVHAKNLCTVHYQKHHRGTLLFDLIGKECECGTSISRRRAIGGEYLCLECATRKRGKSVTYRTVHQQLTRYRGKASSHVCACGCGRAAAEWAMNPGAGTEQEYRNGRWYDYTLDLDEYRPMHRSCHRAMDRAAA